MRLFLIAFLLAFSNVCFGATRLAIIAISGANEGDSIDFSKQRQKYDVPKDADLVRVCVLPDRSQTCQPEQLRWLQFSKANLLDRIDVCVDDLTPGVLAPFPVWSFNADPCKGWDQIPKYNLIPVGVGAFRLSWDAPTVNTDNSTLTDLAGFWIYSSAAGSPLGKLRQLADPTSTMADVSGYGPGQYTFAVSAYNKSGVEGALSASVTGTIDQPAPKTPGAPRNLRIQRLP